MAKLEFPIHIDGLEFVTNVIQKFMDNAEFKDDVSDDYKAGFYEFGNAIINTFNNVTRGDQT